MLMSSILSSNFINLQSRDMIYGSRPHFISALVLWHKLLGPLIKACLVNTGFREYLIYWCWSFLCLKIAERKIVLPASVGGRLSPVGTDAKTLLFVIGKHCLCATLLFVGKFLLYAICQTYYVSPQSHDVSHILARLPHPK